MKTTRSPFWIGLSLVSLATTLLLLDKIGPVSFTFLCGLVFILCLALLGFPRLKELDLRNLKMLLAETREVKEEIYLKEEDLKKYTLAFTKLVAFTGSMMFRTASRESLKRRTKYIKMNCERLLKSLNASEGEKLEALKIMSMVEDRDLAEESGDMDKADEIDQKLKEIISEEIK